MANRYWVGGTGTWDATSTANWSTASGGSSGASVPTTADSVFFDQAGTYTVTLGTSANLNCLDWTVSAGTVTFAGTPSNWSLYGSIDLKSGTVCSFTLSSSNFVLYGVNKTIQTNGVTLSNTGFTLRGTGTYTLLGALTCTNINIVPFGAGTTTIALSGYTLTLTGTSSTFYANSAINFGTGGTLLFTNTSGTLTLTGSPTCVFSGTGTIQFNGSTSSLTGNNTTFTGVTLAKGGTGYLAIVGSNTFDTIKNITQPVTFYFGSGTTTTVTNFNVSGVSGSLVTLLAITAGSQFTISKSSGTVTSNYLSIKDSAATGGATWYAGANSTNVSNNSGWIFTSPTSTAGSFFLVL